MSKWIARLLCAANWHRFDYRVTFVYGSFDQCSRCGYQRDAHIGIETPSEGVRQMVTITWCSICQCVRTTEHDYSPLQVLMGQPLGWYSGSDGEICPEDMSKMMRSQ